MLVNDTNVVNIGDTVTLKLSAPKWRKPGFGGRLFRWLCGWWFRLELVASVELACVLIVRGLVRLGARAPASSLGGALGGLWGCCGVGSGRGRRVMLLLSPSLQRLYQVRIATERPHNSCPYSCSLRCLCGSGHVFLHPLLFLLIVLGRCLRRCRRWLCSLKQETKILIKKMWGKHDLKY